LGWRREGEEGRDDVWGWRDRGTLLPRRASSFPTLTRLLCYPFVTSRFSAGSVRRTTALSFYQLLQLQTWDVIKCSQDEPYGDVHITRTVSRRRRRRLWEWAR
jgi:hypothetical protein